MRMENWSEDSSCSKLQLALVCSAVEQMMSGEVGW